MRSLLPLFTSTVEESLLFGNVLFMQAQIKVYRESDTCFDYVFKAADRVASFTHSVGRGSYDTGRGYGCDSKPGAG